MRKIFRNQKYTSKKVMFLLMGILYLGLSPVTFAADFQTKSIEDVFLSLSVKEQGVKQVFDKIEKETAFSFVYVNEDLASLGPISIQAKQTSLYAILMDVAKQTGLSFKQVDQSIHARKNSKDAPVRSLEKSMEAQITGTVVDDTDFPMPGVTVLVEGTSRGTVTDIDGNFSIDANPGEVLVFSFVGYSSQRVVIGNETNLQIKLGEDIAVLGEVVVIGYGAMKEKDLTSSIATIKTDVITKTPAPNAMQSLQGRVAGVQIVSSGAPGASPTVRVRGVGSFEGNASPLYVVDGMFFENIDFLNPNDIETINILKDASASAIYGVRASNGVVLIETKSGKYNQKPEIVLDSYYGMQVPQNVLKMANTQQFVQYINETGSSADIAFIENAMQRYGRSRVDPNIPNVNTDWYSEIMSPASIQNHNLSFNGGNETTRYSIGGSYFEQKGLLDEARNEYRRLNLRAKLDADIRDWITVGGNFNFSAARQYVGSDAAWFQAYFAVPIQPVFDPQNTDARPFQLSNAQQIGYRGRQNPFYSLYYGDSRNHVGKLMGNIYADIELIPGTLKFRTSYNYSMEQINSRNIGFDYSDGVTNIESSIGRNNFSRFDQVIDNFFTYDHSIDKHRFNVVAGQSFRSEYAEVLFASGTGIAPIPDRAQENLWYLSNATNIDVNSIGDDGNSINSRLFFLSYFGRLSYNYDGRYLLYGTFRRDGNNKFQQKWGNFATIGAGWVVSEEAFFDVPAVDFLKFRASWGQLGNDGIRPSVGRPTIQENTTAINDVLFVGRRLNPTFDLIDQWETTVERNIGVNSKFLNERLSIDADYFIRDTRNLSVNIIPPVFRATERRSVGEIRNEGLEFTVNWQDNIGSSFSYYIGGNFATLQNQVLSLGGPEYLDGGQAEFRQRSIVGEPFQAFFGYETAGIFQNQQEIDRSGYTEDFIAGNNLQPGDFRFVDQNGDGIINDLDRKVLGSFLPKLTYGFNLGFTYKNFDFAALVQGQSGYSILNRKRGEIIFTNDTNIDAELANNLWRGEGTSNKYPSAAGLRNGWNQNMSDYFVEDGSYFRIQNVRLSYKLDEKSLFGVQMPSTRFTFTAERPLTLFNYNGFNPEVANGIDRQVYPIPAVYTLGLTIKL